MPWTKLDDHFHTNPKINALPHGAFRLYVNALNFSTAHLTDGRIGYKDARQLLPRARAKSLQSAIRHLQQASLWVPDKDQKDIWWIHDYGDYQPTKTQLQEEREATRGRVQKHRAAKMKRVTQADGNALQGGDVTVPRPDPTRISTSLSLTHIPPVDLAEEEEENQNEKDWAFPPEGAIIDLWRQALTTTLHHQATSTIRNPHAYTAAIYRNLLTEHHANLENNALVDAIADCPECDTNGLRWSTATNKPTSRDDADAVGADRCNHIRAVV